MLILVKVHWIVKKVYYRSTNQYQRYYNQNLRLRKPLIIRSRWGLLAKVDDTFKLRSFTGPYEKHMIDSIRLSEDSNFIDVGANVGVYTLYAATIIRKGKIIAIEAAKAHYENALLPNIQLNSLQNVVCLNAAVWDTDNEEIKLYDDIISGYNPTCFGGAGVKYNIVGTRTLDSIVAEYGLDNIDYIKMDIEGAEAKALQGAKRTLEITKNVIVEVHGKDKGEQCEKILSDSGFKMNIVKKHNENYYWIFASKSEK